ncbi:hypothetical protein AN0603.2 [Aspergillus nidulans FGSC A4]|nr:hypothetical protein AN0603.2 [Aspergillus nidulans FGSC A4]
MDTDGLGTEKRSPEEQEDAGAAQPES